jgi:hypothetical protein
VTVSRTGEFEFTTDCAAEVTPGASCNVFVHFRPVRTFDQVAGGLTITRQDGQAASIFLVGYRDYTPITHFYSSILLRKPDSPGQIYWSQQHSDLRWAIQQQSNLPSLPQPLATPETWYAMAMSFFGGGEYAAFNRDNDGYLADLYRTFFDREPDGAGVSYWKDQMTQGLPRDGVLLQFMFSPEFVDFTETNYGADDIRAEIVTVLDLYRGLLHRLPDGPGFTYWVDRFQKAQCNGAFGLYIEVESLSKGFAESPEYGALARDNANYIVDLYNAFLRRGPDVAGLDYWKGRLEAGVTRDAIRQAFIASPEFSARVQEILAEPCLP